MIRAPILIILILALVVACTFDAGIPFDESMTAVQEAGYLLSVMKTADMRCFQGLEKDESRVVFMQVYCTIEDQIDMMNFGINPIYSSGGEEKMLEALELIGFPHSKEVLDFFSNIENHLTQGKQEEKTIGTWRVSASTQPAGTDVIIFIGLRSANFIDTVGN